MSGNVVTADALRTWIDEDAIGISKEDLTNAIDESRKYMLRRFMSEAKGAVSAAQTRAALLGIDSFKVDFSSTVDKLMEESAPALFFVDGEPDETSNEYKKALFESLLAPELAKALVAIDYDKDSDFSIVDYGIRFELGDSCPRAITEETQNANH